MPLVSNSTGKPKRVAIERDQRPGSALASATWQIPESSGGAVFMARLLVLEYN